MAVPLAQVDDVAAVWRPVSDEGEVARVAYLINLASAKLRAAVTNLDGRIALHLTTPADVTALDPVLVAGVVAGMVKRVLVNPEGLQSSTRTVGPYSESRTHGASELTGLLVTEADLAELAPRVRPSKVRTLETGLSRRMLPHRPREVVRYDSGGYPLYEGQVP